MKYTKKDIPGILFTFDKTTYKCLEIKDKDIQMATYNGGILGDIFYNTVETTLRYFNDGIWKVITKQDIYEIC